MAVPTDRTYFPSLDELLKGEKTLLSWTLVASALSDASPDRLASSAVSEFVKDPYVLDLLKSPGKAFGPATAHSSAEFATKTAAINLTPTPNDHYDIKTIKEDALWLQKCVGLNEVAALRVVVAELQSQPRAHLMGPLATEDVANLQAAAGSTNGQSSTVFATVDTSSLVDADTLRQDFDKQESKRCRLLATYLSERRSFMASADYITSLMLQARPPSGATDGPMENLRRDVLQTAYGAEVAQKDLDIQVFSPLVSTYIDTLSGCISRAQQSIETAIKDAEVLSEDLAVDWVRTSLTEALHAMALVFQVLSLSSTIFVAPSIASKWFQFADDCGFLDGLAPDNDAISELVSPLKCLVCAISLAMLNLNRALAFLDHEADISDKEEPYVNDSDVLEVIHAAIFGAANANLVSASPVVFCWALILNRMDASYQERAERRDIAQNQRAQAGFELENQPIYPSLTRTRRSSAGSIISIEPARYDRFLSEKVQQQDQQLAEKMAMAVTAGGQVYDVMSEMAVCAGSGLEAAFRPFIGSRIRLGLLDLLKASFPAVGYQSEPVTSFLAILSGGQTYWDLTDESVAAAGSDDTVVALALKDPLLLQFYVHSALSRYPFEFLPFANMCRVLSTCLSSDDTIIKSLLATPTLTLSLPGSFENYVITEDDDNMSLIQLSSDVPLFPPASSWRRHISDEKQVFLPSGSVGRFANGVVQLNYEHSTVALLGKWIDVSLTGETYNPFIGFLGEAETAEAISLLATLIRAETLKASKTAASGSEAGLAILQEASRDLSSAKDIVSVVCDTLDSFIQGDPGDPEDTTLVILNACIEFLHAALPLCPGRVWSYMARCPLLNTESRAGRLSRLTGASDMVGERFNLMISATGFLSSLVDSVMSSAVQRKVGAKFTGRQRDQEGLWIGTSDKILEQVCLSIAQTAVDVFENTTTWKFSSELHRALLVRPVVAIMRDLVRYTFSLETTGDKRGLMGALNSAAQYVIDSFLSSSSASLRFQPLLTSLVVSLGLPDSPLYPRRTEAAAGRLTVVLEFATSLLRVANYLDKTSTAIETQIFQAGSLLARLCAVQDSFTVPSLGLLEALVVSAGTAANEPPSLLGYLGPQISRSFLKILSNLDKPFQRPREAAIIWRLFSAIVRNRQQWMANCLLTGNTPRDALETKNRVSKLSQDSVLAMSKEALRSISSLSSTEALAILDFFTSAQNYWPWTNFAVQSESDYLDDLRSYVRGLKPAAMVGKLDPLAACTQARIAAYIAETFAMQLYHLRQIGREEIFARDVIQDLDYFLRDGVTVSGYNTSLHVNFERNFAKRYPGCSLDDFKRTLLAPENLGAQYYYAIDFAEKMFAFDPAWVGSRDNGFRNEMQTANLNLSLVDAQIALFHAWEFLLLELSVCLLPKNRRIPVTMVQVAEQCLTANQDAQGPEQIFGKLSQARANLALLLVQRLADCSMMPKDITQLLIATWTTMTAVENPFGRGQMEYYRTLLKILYIVLRSSHHSVDTAGGGGGDGKDHSNDLVVSTTQTVLNILDRVVAQGFRTLVTQVHDPDVTVRPEDVALITAVLQACLSVPGTDQCQTQILNIMASYDILHLATSLFSWSDKLAEKGDPVYGELSLLFLLELSALPTVAEQLACDGFLGHFLSASLTTHMRRPNVSPISDSVTSARCYSIWAKAVLPLLLNILIALGATIAPEIAFVLNQFPTLLDASVQRLEAPGLSRTSARGDPHYVTLLGVSEVHSLALLTKVLTVLRESNRRDIAEVPWEAGPLLENVEFWLSRPNLLRERLLPLGQREAEWRAMQPQRKGGQVLNKLEEKVVALLEAVRMVLGEDAEQ